MISTPYNAYKFLLEIGLDKELAKRLVDSGRKTFEYFLRCIDA